MNFNTARLPFYARLDMRVTFRPRWMNDRWQIYAEVVNLLNRDNAGSLIADLVYDPKSDRPKITEERDAALPLLPTFGLRYRFSCACRARACSDVAQERRRTG